jgi:hypothetical protein
LWFVALLRLSRSKSTTSLPSDGNVAIGDEAADAIVNGRRGGGVINLDEVIGGKGWVECDTKQASLA